MGGMAGTTQGSVLYKLSLLALLVVALAAIPFVLLFLELWNLRCFARTTQMCFAPS
jgi:hypothetical protein